VLAGAAASIGTAATCVSGLVAGGGADIFHGQASASVSADMLRLMAYTDR
jgi:hypothetical protein